VKHSMISIAFAAALALTSQARSAELPTPKDGWAAWQIDTVEDAPAWCCFEWDDRDTTPSTCHLDSENHNFASRDHATTDAARVYAHFKDGKLDRLRTLAAACPVETQTPIQKLDVSTDDSTRWFIGLLQRNDLDNDVLAGLAVHRGDLAFDALSKAARGDPRTDKRKHAVFWLAQTRGLQGAQVATDLMFHDPDSDIRRHAIFAVSQSKSPAKAADIIRLGDTDADAQVRAQAWFWLAHTGAPNAEQAISAALKKDGSEHVRDQAIFALSQLPDGRGVHALIGLAEDRSLSREQRKRAVFWLAQSKSDEAQEYLERVLTATTH